MGGEEVQFEAVIEPLVWGRNTYTVITVPATLAEVASRARTRRVEGTIDEVDVNVGLNGADVIEETFIYVGKPLLRRLGARPGDVVDCRLSPADPDHVPLPDDVLRALEDGGRLEAFERLRASQRRQLLVPVESAARPDTRERRIQDLVKALA